MIRRNWAHWGCFIELSRPRWLEEGFLISTFQNRALPLGIQIVCTKQNGQWWQKSWVSWLLFDFMAVSWFSYSLFNDLHARCWWWWQYGDSSTCQYIPSHAPLNCLCSQQATKKKKGNQLPDRMSKHQSGVTKWIWSPHFLYQDMCFQWTKWHKHW